MKRRDGIARDVSRGWWQRSCRGLRRAGGPGRWVPLLIGLGVHELSVMPQAIATTKQAVREVDSGDARALAAALQAVSADEVRSLLAPSS